MATAAGRIEMFTEPFSVSREDSQYCIQKSPRKDAGQTFYPGGTDLLGQTALHKTPCGSHPEAVQRLMLSGWKPLEERDMNGPAAIFRKLHIKLLITMDVSGELGTGKSSLMIQGSIAENLLEIPICTHMVGVPDTSLR
eukprot:Gb_29613 [translate_table: standard]